MSIPKPATTSTMGALLLLGCVAGTGVARAEDSNQVPSPTEAPSGPRTLEPGWHFVLGIYLWTTGLHGDATIGGQNIQIDASFIDVLEAADSLLALDLLFVARKGRWGFLLDPLFVKVGAEGQGPLGVTDFDLTFRIVIAETTGFYTFLQKTRGSSGQTTISIDAILGLRIWWIQISASDSEGLFSRKDSQTWVDPLAGLMFRFDLARGHVPILVRGDFGGWGVGSTIAWGATASVGYRWILRRLDIGLDLAYRALGPDYSNSSQGFGWDVVMHGPAFAVIFGF